MNETLLDVVIIGGGPGGLSAALVLGRSRRNVTVIDADHPRNAVVNETHGFLSRDGINPKELKNRSMLDLEKYDNTTMIKDEVVGLKKQNNTFIVTTKTGAVFYSKKVVVATGVVDDLPDIQGLREVYGTSVFHCPYCDGWERKDEPLAVFGSGEKLEDFTKLIYNISKEMIVFTNGAEENNNELKQALKRRSIPIVETPIKQLQSRDGQLEAIVTIDGRTFHRTGGFLAETGEKQAFCIPENLGVTLNKWGGYETGDHGLTNVEGLYVIGDAKNMFTGLIGSAAEGYEVGVAINHELAMEDWASM
ncbi:NAD(P)/FAD-dependent oxidoreductase [Pueribacillus theae]|uniref:NAD(P)/FAD-dependent oxidoreductase n=1 Tax=Pueribacillus theae TaxID=2171751 RepID=A0A2U1K1D5_9BACI|nr:NAD(P)/FAD-dependent oxidoreductase [Pueribacillus theae]PWA11232.1 NAD(P)/FAD-dependent oxidoreductase [Pueribacillus theae]